MIEHGDTIIHWNAFKIWWFACYAKVVLFCHKMHRLAFRRVKNHDDLMHEIVILILHKDDLTHGHERAI